MFVDASAAVAILALESDRRIMSRKLERAPVILVSAIVMFETCAAIARIKRCGVPDAVRLMEGFVESLAAQTVPIDEACGAMAIVAFDRYGKGRHRAALNMGDCFAYACAKVHKVPLLCKGDDFRHTDIQIA